MVRESDFKFEDLGFDPLAGQSEKQFFCLCESALVQTCFLIIMYFLPFIISFLGISWEKTNTISWNKNGRFRCLWWVLNYMLLCCILSQGKGIKCAMFTQCQNKSVHIKKRLYYILTSCVFWFVSLNASSQNCLWFFVTVSKEKNVDL